MASPQDALDRLPRHLAQVEQDPAHPLDKALFESVVPFVAAADVIDLGTSQALIERLARLLPDLQQDPTPAIRLLIKLLQPFDFDAVRSLQPPVDFAAGLDLAAVPYHPLALTLLEKASLNGRHAEFIASIPDVVSRLLQLWLSTEDIGIADRAGNVLFEFLKVDKDPADVLGIESAPGAITGTNMLNEAGTTAAGTTASYGTGFMWKRVFGDKDIYGLFFHLCGAEGPSQSIPAPGRSQRTVAQARLMSWLSRVGALSWDAATHSHHPDVEESYRLKSNGLLDFIAVHAVDYDGDVLMHISLMEFYSDLLKTCSQPAKSTASHHVSVALEYLKTSGLHGRTLSYFLAPSSHESFEISYLYRPAANYLSTYASTYPTDFEASSTTRTAALRRLVDVFGNMKPAQWVHGDSPRHDLHVLASIPRTTLLADSAALWVSTPLSLIPASSTTNADALHTLATIFHGPDDPDRELAFPAPAVAPSSASSSRLDAERVAARTLFTLYTQHNSTFWSDLVQQAETLALKDTAVAALDLISELATANWSTSPSDAVAADPPPSGLATLLRPGNPILPYLLRPAPSFSNLVGGRGDAENAAYVVAVRKFDVLKTVLRRLEGSEGAEVPGREGLLELVGARMQEGVWGRGGDVGGRIGTLEL